MSFSLATWRNEVHALVADFATDPWGALARSGLNSLYGFLLGSTMLPVVTAYATDPGNTVMVVSSALAGLAGGVGANLLSNIVQQKYDAANVITVAAQEVQTTEFAPAYEALAQKLEIIKIAEEELVSAGQTATLNELREELPRLGKTGQFAGANISVNQSGGVNLGIGNTIGSIGDIVGGDKTNARGAQGFVDRPSSPVHQHFGTQRTINMGGGDYAEGNIDKRSGSFANNVSQAQPNIETIVTQLQQAQRQVQGHNPDLGHDLGDVLRTLELASKARANGNYERYQEKVQRAQRDLADLARQYAELDSAASLLARI